MNLILIFQLSEEGLEHFELAGNGVHGEAGLRFVGLAHFLIEFLVFFYVEIFVKEEFPKFHKLVYIEFCCRNSTDSINDKETFQLVRDNDDVFVPVGAKDAGAEGCVSILTKTGDDVGVLSTNYFNGIFYGGNLTLPDG